MIRSIIGKPSNLTATLSQYLKPHVTSASVVPIRCRCRCRCRCHYHYRPLISPSTVLSQSYLASRCFSKDSSTANSPPTQSYELTRVATLLDGCDYEHWLVVMEAPKGNPLRDEIIHVYVKTLAFALGSVEEAKKSIYSVSTKYYYAFGCKIPENLTYKIKSLPNVRWVLPDSYLHHGENDYGGEPFVDGEVVPYDEKYHADWLRDQNYDKSRNKTGSRKARRKEKNK